MNANATTTSTTVAELAQSIGNGAAYTLWVAAPLLAFGFFVILLNLDAPALGTIGAVYAGIVVVSMAALAVLVGSSKVVARFATR